MPNSRSIYTKIDAPTIFVLFGITGDLAKRKVLPALFDLYACGHLPKRFAIIGFSRRDLATKNGDGDDGVRQYVKKIVSKGISQKSKKKVPGFLEMIHYQQGDFMKAGAYGDLAEHIIRLDERFGQCTNKIFHLAVPPGLYSPMLTHLAHSGLTIPCSNKTGWTRVLVEKPFGNDLHSARTLDRKLGLLFKEQQIYRIDHYLGKEILQDILAFRFANTLFQQVWNNRFVDRITIRFNEKIDVGSRGDFYDGVGTLRDVGENHMLQMLALVAMERPTALNAGAIRKARAILLQSLRPLSPLQIRKRTFRGQYKGFRTTKGVAKSSKTETFFRLQAEIKNRRWRGVPIIMEAGKGLSEHNTGITVHFKPSVNALTPRGMHCDLGNALEFNIEPRHEIAVQFISKKSGFTFELEPAHLVFSKMSTNDFLPDAYETVIFEAIHGDQTLFTSTAEVEASWKFITPIVRAWERGVVPLKQYKKGSSPDDICTKQ